MKIRTGFVSNSSSSSFVLLFEKDKEDVVFSKNENKSYFSIASLLFLIRNSEESKIECRGFDAYIEKLRCYGWSEDYLESKIRGIEKEKKDNIELVYVSIEDRESAIVKALQNLEDCEQVKVFVGRED